MTNHFDPADVGRLAAALPPDGTNPIGNVARGELVNKTKGQTPGRETGSLHRTFVKIFFPNYQPGPYVGLIEQYTGLQVSFFSSLAVITLCEAMYNATSSLRRQLLIDKINADLDSANGTIRNVAARWYAFIATVVNSDIKV